MTADVRKEIRECLIGLVNGRVFAGVAPEKQSGDYIVYTKVGGEVTVYLDASIDPMEGGEFLVRCWGKSMASIATLSGQVAKALSESDVLGAEPTGGAVDDYDEETKLFGSLQYFRIWFAHPD